MGLVPAFNCLSTKLLSQLFLSLPSKLKWWQPFFLYCFSKWQKCMSNLQLQRVDFIAKGLKCEDRNILNENLSKKYSRANLTGQYNVWKVNHFSAAVLISSKRITAVPIVGGDIISELVCQCQTLAICTFVWKEMIVFGPFTADIFAYLCSYKRNSLPLKRHSKIERFSISLRKTFYQVFCLWARPFFVALVS